MWFLAYVLPGFGVGGSLTWLALMFTPMAGDWVAIVVVGGLAGGVWALWQGRRRHRRRLRLLTLPPERWQHGDQVAVRGRLVCLEPPLRTPLGEDAALYGYRADWQPFEPRSGRQSSPPTRQAEGYAMTVCAIEAQGRQIPLRGVPDTGGSRRRRSSEPADLERLARYWIDSGIRPFETGVAAAREFLGEFRQQRRNGRVPTFAGLGPMRADTLFPGSEAGKALKPMLAAAAAPPEPAEIARLLQRYEGVLHEEWIEPGAEVVVVGTWNAGAGRIDCGSTSPAQPGDPIWSGKARLGADSTRLLLRLPAAGAAVPAPGHRLFVATLALWLALVLPLAWFLAPLASPSPRLSGPLQVVDLALIAAGDLHPLTSKLLEPPWPPEQLARIQDWARAGDEIPREWQWRLDDLARQPAYPAEPRLRSLERVLAVLRPDLNRSIDSALTPLYVTRGIGGFALLDTRGASMEALLRHGADPNFVSAHGETALHRAASTCDRERVQRLLEAGADPNPSRSAVEAAAERLAPPAGWFPTPFVDDCLATAHLLIAAGGRGGGASVLRAVRERRLETLSMLIAAGFDIDAEDPDFGTPLEAAVFAGRSTDDEAARSDFARAVELLKAAGAAGWPVSATNGQAVGNEHPAAQALIAVYRAIQDRDEATIKRLYPSHGRWRAERSPEQLADYHLPEPLPPFTVEGFANAGSATLRFHGRRANGKGFDWYAQMTQPGGGDCQNNPWVMRRRWGGEPRPF